MSQIEDLQGRIAAALDRIGQGIDRMGEAGGTEGAAPAATEPAEIEALRQELEDEKVANEQLRERVKKLQVRRQRLEEELQSARDDVAGSLKKFDGELQGLRAANEKLREINGLLREANGAGVGDAELINTAMEVELEGLRAVRAADELAPQLRRGEHVRRHEARKLGAHLRLPLEEEALQRERPHAARLDGLEDELKRELVGHHADRRPRERERPPRRPDLRVHAMRMPYT